MILRSSLVLYAVSAFLSLLVSSAHAQDGSTFDCRVTTNGIKFDLTSLAGEHTAKRKRETPPTSTVDLLRFNLCAELDRQEDVAESDQCAKGTRACFTQINSKPDEKDRILSVIPLMSASTQNLEFQAGTSSPKYITINSTGAEYPHPSNSTPIHPLLSLTILCSDKETSDPVLQSFDDWQVVVAWSTPAGCPIEGDQDGDHHDNDDNKEPPKDDNSKRTGSGISWFFLVLLLAFAAYFGLGAYHNYTTYGARGADLLPHRDFWKEVPYMFHDVIGHLCSSVPPRRSTNRGYIAV